MTSSSIPDSKLPKSTHAHQPRGAFSFNTRNIRVNTEAEYEQLYNTEFQSLGSPKHHDSPAQRFDTPQMVEVQDLPGTTRPEEESGPSLGAKRDYTTFSSDLTPHLNNPKRYVNEPIYVDTLASLEHPISLVSDLLNTAPDNALLESNSEQSLTLHLAQGPYLIEQHLSNPFAENSTDRYSEVKRDVAVALKDGAVDGYLKFRWGLPESSTICSSHSRGAKGNYGSSTFGVHHQEMPSLGQGIPKLPRSFAVPDLDQLDKQFFRFYLSAFCKGRTLLSKTNLWLSDIAPMVSTNEGVKHALLALSAGYWLHFRPNETVVARANSHYQKANEILTKEMHELNARQLGNEDGLVAAILLLFIDDAVNYELRGKRQSEARWRSGARTARWILTQSDPGQRYWKPSNVQCTAARTSNANFVAFVEITAQIVTPLRTEDTDQMYLWLLHGREAESRQVHGSTGLCSKLLHIFAQITSLCTHMATQSGSVILPHGGNALLDMLTNFRQTSDLSLGYPTTEALLRSCDLDENGKVTDIVKVTELTAEAWVATAKIYLLCRFFRKPRSHSDVQAHLKTLLRCIGWMPCTGKLFTSQSPLLCVFIMCMVSETEVDRAVGKEWFETVTGDASNRSSVPPVWGAVKRMWDWLDQDFREKEYDDSLPIGDRHAWWEEVTTMLIETEGEIALY